MGKNAEAKQQQEKQAEIDTKWILKSPFLQVRQDTIKVPRLPPKVWNIAIAPGAVAVLPIDAEKRVILVEQWRRAIGHITLEIPAGMLDPGESPLQCAQRELQEEAGCRADSIEPLGGCFTSPGMFSEYIHLFIAKDLVESRLVADDTDGIDVRSVSLPEALKMITTGEICDAKTIIALLRYAHHV